MAVVAIAGASGFVGKALARVLAPNHSLIGLSRSGTGDAVVQSWRRCDLFNLREAEAALAGATHAYYLVHSMMPSARLTQGDFADFDLVCADNFARAAKTVGCQQIVYLGGLLPASRDISQHLASRREVEQTLGRYGVPLTTLRAGIVIGAGGSSFQMIERLVRRLPAMLGPKWTRTRTQPIALADVVALLVFALDNPRCLGETFDVGAPESMSYRDLITLCARLLGLHRPFVPVPFLSPGLSRLWVSTITGAPRELVAPLVESLRHEMVAGDRRLAEMAGLHEMSVEAAMRAALAATPDGDNAPHAFVGARAARRTTQQQPKVRSVQRMPLPPARDAAWASDEYLRWLPRALRSFIYVETSGDEARFRLAVLKLTLLVLTRAPSRSKPDRQLFFVTGGLLSGRDDRLRPRFEIRQVLDGRTLLTAIHDFRPRLPWLIYAATQALVHAWVMAAFRRHLARQCRISAVSERTSG